MRELFLSSLILLAWTAALGVAGLWSVWLLVPPAIILVPFKLLSTAMRKSMGPSAPVFRGFRKVITSRTEKELNPPGTTWWEGDLFQAKPDWKKLHNHLSCI